MFHPDAMYQMAKHEHQERIHAAARSHEARAARPVRPARPAHHHNWFAALANRLRTVHDGGASVQVLDGGGQVSAETSVRGRTVGDVATA